MLEAEKASVIRLALSVIAEQTSSDTRITSPEDAQAFLQLKLAPEKREVFAVLFLDSKHRVIAYEALFKGSVDHCSVHPRVVLQRCLELNATALILAHNHPSSNVRPSASDIKMTSNLINTLALVEVRVLDHIIVGKKTCLSMAENGFMSEVVDGE